ncbi:uncharacterized protein LOC115920227 [Strongylocentrotus purpuratus]|uniref:Uncharacterized protein n=1 Tax=Strongylocentrotus purpuratus TaxID=7668 RepID=A0A7M7N5F4_STRPU|nr:uncharacterized protein LOC115920227 [Strongylocentrotus purpuratus]|eukprot:XP_800381.1 PREDICTED: uncharacterized protein LOC586178 [Strongylocentrotus purpuratus]
MSYESCSLLSPRVHSMNLRVPNDLHQDYSENEAEKDQGDHLLSTDKRQHFAAEPLEVVNMGLQHLRTARGTATRRLRTVKKAWGTFKAKAKKHTAAPQPKLRPQQLWSISLSSPNSPSARALILNSPLTPNPYATPGNSNRYRQESSLTTPVTPFSPLRRSARIAGQTPTPCRDGKTRTRTGGRRTTPKRIQLNASPGHILRELNAMTLQTGQRPKSSRSSGVDAFKAMSEGLSQTITKQDSSGKLTEIPIQKPAATKDKSTDAMESKENEPEPSRIVRLRRNRGVVISQNATDGQMLTEMLV